MSAERPSPTKNPATKLLFGFSTLGCHDLDLTAVRALAIEHGNRLVEFRSLGGSLDLAGELVRFPGGASAAREFLQAGDISVSLVASSFAMTRSRPFTRKPLTRVGGFFVGVLNWRQD